MIWLHRLLETPPLPLAIFCAALGLVLWAQRRFDTACELGARFASQRWLTGSQSATELLAMTEMDDVRIELGQGAFADYYDVDRRVLSLSAAVHGGPTLTAVTLAALEAGHAMQDRRRDAPMPLRIRDATRFVARLGAGTSALTWIVGLVLDIGLLMHAGLILYGLVALVVLVSLPLERDAVRRASRALAMSAQFDSRQEALATRILDAAVWQALFGLLPRMRTPRWRRIRPQVPSPSARTS